MNNEQNHNSFEIVKNPQYKKIWYSMTKFEKYPDMASEGVARAFKYLAILMFCFALIFAVGLLIKMHITLNSGVKLIEGTFSEINYKDGELLVLPEKYEANTDMGNLIIDTGELTEDQIVNYEQASKSSKLNIIWLKNKVIVKNDMIVKDYYYKDILEKFNIEEFNKQTLIKFLSEQLNNPKIYIIYTISITIYTFISYFITTLLDILMLSLYGMLTTLIAGIKIRYRAVFNMSVYAFTLSIILQLIYMCVNLFTGFEIKYCDIMYTTISFICLAAAIFMIKSDVIKQQMQLMRIIEIKQQEKQENKEESPEEENKEGEEEKKEEKKDELDKEDGAQSET